MVYCTDCGAEMLPAKININIMNLTSANGYKCPQCGNEVLDGNDFKPRE